MANKYYSKSIITTPLHGAPSSLRWISCGDGSGVAETSDPAAIAFLDDRIARCKSGIGLTTAEDYAKKKSAPKQPRRTVTAVPSQPTRVDRVQAAGAVVGEDEPTREITTRNAPIASDSPSVGAPPAGVVPPNELEEP